MTQPTRPGPQASPPPGSAPPQPPARPGPSARGRELIGLAPFVGASLLLFVVAQVVAAVAAPAGGVGQIMGSTVSTMTAGALFACAISVTLHARSLDLSIFGTVAVCGVVLAAVGGVLGALVALVVALVAGVVNAALAGLLRLHSVATTLGSGFVMLGIALASGHGPNRVIRDVLPRSLTTVILVLLVLVAVAVDVLYLFTPLGRNVPDGLRRSLAHVAAALLAGLGAVAQAAVIRSAFVDTGVWMLVGAVAAAFLGGTSASGRGRSLVGVVLAAAFLSSITVTVALVGAGPYVGYVLVGVLLVLAVGGDRLRTLLLEPKAATPNTPPRPASPAQ